MVRVRSAKRRWLEGRTGVSCYVDAVRAYPDAGLRFVHFCHLLADDRTELHELAARLDMPRRLFQDHPVRWHYDLPAPLRPRALELGAAELSTREVADLLAARRWSVRQAGAEPAQEAPNADSRGPR